MAKSKQQHQNCGANLGDETDRQKYRKNLAYVNLNIEEQKCGCKRSGLNQPSMLNEERECPAEQETRTISTGFINVPLIPLKLILFSWYAAGACLLPYMSLHMQQLGLNIAETAAVYTILPIIQLFGTPIAGFVADKTGNYKSVLMLSLSTCIVATFLIQFAIPVRKRSHTNNGSMEETQDSSQDSLYKATFWLYLFIRTFHQVAVGLSYVLLDTTTIVLAEQNNSTYGKQRFWAILATGLFSPICGFVIDNYSYHIDEMGEKVHNYGPAFYFFSVLTIFTLSLVSIIEVEIFSLPRNIWTDVMPLIKSANVWIFLFSVFIMGSCWGFLELYLFIYLKKMDAPNYLLGLTVTIGAFIGLPFLYRSDWFIKKFGAIQLLFFALFVYFVRLIGYSLIDNPWWCIPYELMEAFTLHLMWVATVQLAYQISPPGMLATLQGVVSGLNLGVGRGFGSLVGGSVAVLYGNRIAFRVVGCIALITSLVYALLHYFCLPPLEIHDKKTQATKSDHSSTNLTITCSSKPATDHPTNMGPKFSTNLSEQSSKRRRQMFKDYDASGEERTKLASGTNEAGTSS